VTWNAVFKLAWSNTGNTANKISSVTVEYNGTNWIAIGGQAVWF
jgi:hypothetical protein